MKHTTQVRTVAAVVALLLAASFIAGCSQGKDASVDQKAGGVGSAGAPSIAPSAPQESLTNEAARDTAVSQPVPTPEGTVAETDRMIISTQTLRLEVESTPDAVEALRALAADSSAVITDLQVATDTDQWLYRYDQSGLAVGDGAALRGWMTVRVPAESLSAFVDGARKLGTVKYQSEGTEDVTQQHVDLTARLENLKAEELRLRGFFDSAKTVQDMLLVETELNRVRQEIESLDAQVKYLERQAAMATVTIELTEKQPTVRPEGQDWGFKDAITSGFRGAANVLTFAIAFIIATAPLWIVGLAVFFIVRAIWKRRRARRAAETVASSDVYADDTDG